MTKTVAVACLVVASAAGLSAEQARIDPAANAKLGALRRAGQADAYRKLFEARGALGHAIAQETRNTAAAAKRKIVCGMTVIEAGPELDPKMGVTPSKDDHVKHTIRAVPPPVCGAAR